MFHQLRTAPYAFLKSKNSFSSQQTLLDLIANSPSKFKVLETLGPVKNIQIRNRIKKILLS